MLLPLLALLHADLSFTITLDAGKADRRDEIVRVPLVLPKSVRPSATLQRDGKDVPLALLRPGLLADKAPEGKEVREAWFVLDSLDAGKTLTLKLTVSVGKPGIHSRGLRWKEGEGTRTLVNARGDEETSVLRYEMPKLDESSPLARENSFKVFHQVFDDGKMITKGPGGKFTHHRGLFYGFMKASYDKHTVDIWHCKGQTHQAHRELLDESPTNPVVGRHRVAIDWNGVGGKTFASEERELSAVPLPGGTLIEFTSRLTPKDGDLKLDGDPQHAGFHFRASNEVAAKTEKETYFVRPSGVGEKGEETNWPANKKHVDLPWLGMSFVVAGQSYTVGYIDHPSNPKEARFSERAYGRFGSYFVTTVKKEEPLVVRYRVWVQKGEMKPEALAALAAAFVAPVKVTVK